MSLTLLTITQRWQAAIKSAKETKRRDFGLQAKDAMAFYGSADHSFLYTPEYQQDSLGLRINDDFQFDKMTFQGTINLTSNVVEVFLPVLYHRNPLRTVAPRLCELDMQAIQMAGVPLLPDDVQAAQQNKARLTLKSQLAEHRLNATPRELNLKDHARLSVLEALVKGMGLLVGTVYRAEDGTKLFGLQHDSIDHWYVDADAEHPTWLDGGYVVRRRTRPIRDVERDFDLAAGTLREAGRIGQRGSDPLADEDEAASDAESNPENASQELFTYYEVYSRIGMGQSLKTAGNPSELDSIDDAVLDQFGKYCWLAIPDAGTGYEYPLNLPKELFEQEADDALLEQIKARVAWPVEFYRNRTNPWPCVVLGFHPKPRSPWCHSHVTPVMGIQKSIDWIMSFMMGRIYHTSRALLLCPQNLPDRIKELILHGGDLTLAELEMPNDGTQKKILEIVEMPSFKEDLWRLLGALKQEFEDGTGVTELNMAGRSRVQMRSAKEADVKQQMLSIRPDDMANLVENWAGQAAKLEFAGAASLETEDDIARVFGEPLPSKRREELAASGMLNEEDIDAMCCGPYTRLWMDLIASADLDTLFAEMDCTIESGSARKPNIDQQITNNEMVMQVLFPAYLQLYQATGDPTQINTLLTDLAKTHSMSNYQGLLFPDRTQEVAMAQAQQAMMAAGQGGGPPPQGNGQPSPGSNGQPPQGAEPPQPSPADAGLPPQLLALLAQGGQPQGMMN